MRTHSLLITSYSLLYFLVGVAKKIKTVLKLNLPAGTANPAPPVGPALGQHGVNIMQFVQAYNEKTKDKKGQIIPAVMHGVKVVGSMGLTTWAAFSGSGSLAAVAGDFIMTAEQSLEYGVIDQVIHKRE